MGTFKTTVDQLFHHYVRPQENGNRSQVRWVQLSDDSGSGITIKKANGQLFNFSAWPYSQAHLADATHIHELVKDDLITLNIDLIQKGVGGDVPAGGEPHEEYRLLPGELFVFSFMMQPLINNSFDERT